jgi:CheY-like chemotaxis protein
MLVVDDIRPIAEGFAGKFRRYSEEHFNMKAEVEVLCTSDEAVRRISDESKPELDLIFTDIDLHGGDSPDKSGVALARFARARISGVPVVGSSGKFAEDDLSDEDREIFDKCWSKGNLAQNLSELTKDTLDRAISYHKIRHPLGTIMPNSVSVAVDSVLHTPETNGEFIDEGYSQVIIEPSNHPNQLAEPFAVWKKDSNEGVELEVVGCGAIFTWGDTYEDAEDALMEIINDLRKTLHEPNESFSKSLLPAKRFVETVTGFRNEAGVA